VKAQISFVEFIVSFSIFSVFVAYLFFRLLSFMPAYLNEIRSERVRSEAYQVSELLINDLGEPVEWQAGPDDSIRRIGLSDIANKTNFLSVDKVDRLEEECTDDYEEVRKWIGTDFQFSIFIADKNGVISVTCIPQIVIVRDINATVRRMVAFGPEDYGELIVNVW